jgi:Fe-Mn family superoxide dismutase
MAFTLPPLPYATDALVPHFSKETLEFHHGKHHNAYVVKLNELIPGTKFEHSTLEEIILSAEGPIYNQAAQIWNHTFFWNCLTPKSSGKPSGKLLSAIESTWGSFEAFKTEYTAKTIAVFGSGWSFLAKDKDGKLLITQEGAAGNPMKQGLKPVLTCDVWEHAYYIDFRNLRPKYLEAFWALVNWDFASKNFEG